MSVALCPVHGFPMFPGWMLFHRLLRPVCPICPVAPQARLPFTGKDRWFLGSCLVTGLGLASEHVLPDRELENRVLRIGRHLNLPNMRLGFIAILCSTIYSSPGIADHVCPSRLGHVSPSPLTG